jgi:hypothetical protein
MEHTVFSPYTTEELLNFAQLRDKRTDLEVELAQRLELALQRIEELEGDD